MKLNELVLLVQEAAKLGNYGFFGMNSMEEVAKTHPSYLLTKGQTTQATVWMEKNLGDTKAARARIARAKIGADAEGHLMPLYAWEHLLFTAKGHALAIDKDSPELPFNWKFKQQRFGQPMTLQFLSHLKSNIAVTRKAPAPGPHSMRVSLSLLGLPLVQTPLTPPRDAGALGLPRGSVAERKMLAKATRRGDVIEAFTVLAELFLQPGIVPGGSKGAVLALVDYKGVCPVVIRDGGETGIFIPSATPVFKDLQHANTALYAVGEVRVLRALQTICKQG